jgi:hypothetical protein
MQQNFEKLRISDTNGEQLEESKADNRMEAEAGAAEIQNGPPQFIETYLEY